MGVSLLLRDRSCSGMSRPGIRGQPLRITVRFDRPFLFFVRDVETGTILFMGRVVDPSDTP